MNDKNIELTIFGELNEEFLWASLVILIAILSDWEAIKFCPIFEMMAILGSKLAENGPSVPQITI